MIYKKKKEKKNKQNIKVPVKYQLINYLPRSKYKNKKLSRREKPIASHIKSKPKVHKSQKLRDRENRSNQKDKGNTNNDKSQLKASHKRTLSEMCGPSELTPEERVKLQQTGFPQTESRYHESITPPNVSVHIAEIVFVSLS